MADKKKAVEVRHLSKSFKIKEKEKGFLGSLKSLTSKKFKIKEAVSNVSFDVYEGEMVAFLGPNGAGKSTTIKMLTGILQRDEGDIKVLGLDPSKDRKELARNIGTVFGQKEQLWMHLTPYDNFIFFGSIYDIDAKEVEKTIEEFDKIFDLKEILNTPVRNLSLGQRIKCEIVASLIHKPKILFLDEPTIGLDPVVKEKIRFLIKKMNRELGLTIFLTSHDIEDIEKLCKRIIIINSGKLVTDESMKSIREKYFVKKIVKLKLKDKINTKPGKGFTILKDYGDYFKFEVDTRVTQVTDIFHFVPENLVLDISVNDVSLESVIKDIYEAPEE